MAYIGKIPAAAALTASDIADGIISADKLATNSVTQVKVADDAIALAELKAGTDGELITWDASGNPVAVAVGSDGQVLTSTGAGSPPAFEAAVGGAWTKIKTIALSGSTSSVIFLNGSSDVVIDNTYSTYKVIWNGVSGYDSTDSIMYAQVYDGGTDGSGTSLDTGSNYTYGTRSYDNHSTILYSYALGASYMQLYTKAIDNQARRGYAGEFTAYNVNQVAADICTKFFRLAGTSNDAADGYAMHNSMIGTWENAADTVRGFKFYPSAGTFGRGEFILYGIK
jgi:hypothetical protein